MEKITYQEYSRILVRIGISLVFLWFGLNQIFDSENFIGYLPDFLLNLSYAHYLVMLNGIFEVTMGGLLITGFFLRPAALVLSLHLIFIILSLGYNDIAVRDFGLMVTTFAIFLGGKDKWSLDYNRKKH